MNRVRDNLYISSRYECDQLSYRVLKPMFIGFCALFLFAGLRRGYLYATLMYFISDFTNVYVNDSCTTFASFMFAYRMSIDLHFDQSTWHCLIFIFMPMKEIAKKTITSKNYTILNYWSSFDCQPEDWLVAAMLFHNFAPSSSLLCNSSSCFTYR